MRDAELSAATQVVSRDLEGCFDEWSQRQALEAIEGIKRPKPTDASITVRLGITPDGTTHDLQPSGELDYQRDGSTKEVRGALSFCVEAAIARSPFPKGSEALDVEVQVVWSQGNVNTGAHVVGRHEASNRAADF